MVRSSAVARHSATHVPMHDGSRSASDGEGKAMRPICLRSLDGSARLPGGSTRSWVIRRPFCKGRSHPASAPASPRRISSPVPARDDRATELQAPADACCQTTTARLSLPSMRRQGTTSLQLECASVEGRMRVPIVGSLAIGYVAGRAASRLSAISRVGHVAGRAASKLSAVSRVGHVAWRAASRLSTVSRVGHVAWRTASKLSAVSLRVVVMSRGCRARTSSRREVSFSAAALRFMRFRPTLQGRRRRIAS